MNMQHIFFGIVVAAAFLAAVSIVVNVSVERALDNWTIVIEE